MTSGMTEERTCIVLRIAIPCSAGLQFHAEMCSEVMPITATFSPARRKSFQDAIGALP